MSILNHNFRRAITACSLCTAAMFGLQAQAAVAVGVDEMAFELDGNIVATANSGKVDWKDLFNTASTPPTAADPLPADFGRVAFIPDFDANSNKDVTTYTTGSKDTLNITPGWQCVIANNVNDKIDVLNAYAAVYSDPISGHVVLYFAQEVASNEGTKDLGFWFLKDPTVGCLAGNKASDYKGKHSDGDILIVAEYTNGGGVSVIRAYKWVKGPNDPVGFLETKPFVESGSCSGAGHGTSLCAVINDKALLAPTDVPWPTKTKTANPVDPNYRGPQDLDVGEFFEGGLDLTANNIEGCFNRYLADTRSSTSLTATLFDYVLGEFSICKITVDKTCQKATVDPTDRASFLSPFNVLITNKGIGQIYDVTLSDSFPTGESCRIVKIGGTDKDTLLTSGTKVPIVDTLAKGASTSVDIRCDGGLDSFTNAVHVEAGSSDGGSDLNADDTVTAAESDSTACKVTPTGSLSATKVCNGIDLVNNGGFVGLQVKVAITVKNSASATDVNSELVQGITVVDDKVKAADLKPVSCTDGTATTFDGSLLPDEKACFTGTYMPASTDVPSPPFDAPSKAFFSDNVKVTGKGALSNTSLEATAKATCNLCDLDLDGTPDAIDTAPNDPNIPPKQ